MSSASTDPAPPASDTVAPTRDDRDIADASPVIGDPVGDRAVAGDGFWHPLRVAVGVALLGYVLAIFARVPCIDSGFAGISRYTHMCYSDIPVLYSLRGFADGYPPYLDHAPGAQGFEYPVLTGAMAQFAAWLTGLFGGGAIGFYAANVALIGALLIVTVVATGLTTGRRRWDAVLVAASPALLLPSTINWDMLAVALVAVFLLLWSRRVLFWSGVVLGLAISAKFYPLILLGPLFLLCLRAGKLPAFGRMLVGAVLGWLVANVPVMLVNYDGWAEFYTFSSTRGQDFGSPWLALSIAGINVPADQLNLVATGAFALCCLGLAWFIGAAPRRPRLAPMLFIVLAAFLLTNKVYSPQYMMWLVPLAVLSLPRLRWLALWQAGELLYFAAVWLYLAGLENPGKGLPAGWYSVSIWIHIGLTLWFIGMLVRDAWWPAHDPVRADAQDDPAGGVLEGADDRRTWGRFFTRSTAARHASA